MPKINILSSIANRLGPTYFTEEQKRRIVLAVTSFHNVAGDLKGFVIDLFRLLLVGDTAFKKEALIKFVEQIAFQDNPVKYFRVSEGETWCLDITLKAGEDFTGLFLTARNKENNTLLSPNNVAGSSQTAKPVQQIPINDMNLAADTFYVINFMTETNAAGIASGDATTLLTEAYIISNKNIDV